MTKSVKRTPAEVALCELRSYTPSHLYLQAHSEIRLVLSKTISPIMTQASVIKERDTAFRSDPVTFNTDPISFAGQPPSNIVLNEQEVDPTPDSSWKSYHDDHNTPRTRPPVADRPITNSFIFKPVHVPGASYGESSRSTAGHPHSFIRQGTRDSLNLSHWRASVDNRALLGQVETQQGDQCKPQTSINRINGAVLAKLENARRHIRFIDPGQFVHVKYLTQGGSATLYLATWTCPNYGTATLASRISFPAAKLDC